MRAIVRAARSQDLEPLYEMAKLTGGGFTNLPADRDALAERLAASDAAYARDEDALGDDLYLLMLEDLESGRIAGTAQIITRTGQRGSFHSYRRTTLTQHSAAFGRSFKAEMLVMTNDLEGCSEVGGLFLHPRFRAGGLGLLLARSRYLFIKLHRARFADKLIAELRGVIDEGGGSPFWDGVGGRFFQMSFREADDYNARHGNQHLADLMPRHPIYLAMLSEMARGVIGVPHATGRAAMRMLEAEGFADEGYLDIFEGGPTMTAMVDRLRTVREAREAEIASVGEGGGIRSIVAAGRLCEFRAAFALLVETAAGLEIDGQAAEALALRPGREVLHVAR
ncbi:arginine N-succinyltransferase [Sphingomonas sp. BIUV-7]|uniref:Arginine N-succinyltransferase n=1 Tax=Sphingomonas natans TaxID=3063330 RepID=A0ABT8YD93_9SPHN|nr:arginine N-succinyltransferase [Sphingomonas sp. BIUV-7]MDO6415753.1 arginine N-succinyltransferase [Sphingomonas sp. BIUV-7]